MFSSVAKHSNSNVRVAGWKLINYAIDFIGALPEPLRELVMPDSACQDLRVHAAVTSANLMLRWIMEAANVQNNIRLKMMASEKFDFQVALGPFPEALQGKRYQHHGCPLRWH